MNGQTHELERLDAKKELERIRTQIHNTRHNLKMLEAMENKLEEMTR